MISVSLHSVLLAVTVAHLMIAAVMSLFARHRVQYLSLAAIMGLFGFAFMAMLFFAAEIESATPMLLDPGLLMGLTAAVFLQSIYPLSIPMPAYLQWKRMLIYAAPAICVFVVYGFLSLFGFHPVHFHMWREIPAQLFTSDILLRFVVLGLSFYYMLNMFRLPRTLLQHPDIPNYLAAYTVGLGLSSCIFVWLTLDYSLWLFIVWLVILTLQNLYMCFRTLETLALGLPKPEILKVETEPSVVETNEGDDEDFNEANRHRFERIEFWMQNHREEWTDNTFGRDRLCEAVGYNRHLVLQCIRSQGYYNVHEYINRYRIEELKRLITKGKITTLGETVDAGFGAIQTARSCFLKMEGITLDEYWNQKKSPIPPDKND